MDNNRTPTAANSSSTTSATTTTTTASTNSTSSITSSSSSSSTRQSHKRTFSESDSSSRTERHLCSFSHLWIINYLSSYIDDSNSNCLQSESFSPTNTPYSNTRWSLKLYPRGLNEKQHTNNNIAIFLKYVSGNMSTIKAKAEFSVVSRNNELVMLRSTNFHTFSSGNDWGYSEFLDGTYLNTRRNDLLTDDRLRVYVRVILVDEKETVTGDIFHHHHHPSQLLPPYPIQQQQQHQTTAAATAAVPAVQKTQASTSSSSASSSSATSMASTHSSSTTSTTPTSVVSGLFTDDKERFKSMELLSKHIKTLLDDERFADVKILVIPKQQQQQQSISIQQHVGNDDGHKRSRMRHQRVSSKQRPSCSSCCCTSEKSKTMEQLSDQEQSSSSAICKDLESDSHLITALASQCYTSPSSSTTPTTRRTTRSTTSLLSRIAQSSETALSSNCSTSAVESSSSDSCSSSSIVSIFNSKRCCSCTCHHQDHNEFDMILDHQPITSIPKFSNLTPLATFHAHKAILMARSSAFAVQLRNNNYAGPKAPPIEFYIDGLHPSTVRAMLIYIYAGRLPTPNDDTNNNGLNAIDLFRAAVQYDLIELRDLAKSTMLDVLRADNAIEMLEVSDQANDLLLKQQVLAFIRSNASAVSKTDHWLNFSKRHPHLIIDAFRSLVTPPTITGSSSSSTLTKHNNTSHNNNNHHHHHAQQHSTSTTTTTTTTSSKHSKYD